MPVSSLVNQPLFNTTKAMSSFFSDVLFSNTASMYRTSCVLVKGMIPCLVCSPDGEV